MDKRAIACLLTSRLKQAAAGLAAELKQAGWPRSQKRPSACSGRF